MTSGPASHLQIQAELALDVDDLHAALTADGSRITVRSEDFAGLLKQASAALLTVPDGRPSVRQLAATAARTLDNNGLSARVVGPRGTVVELGHDCATPGSRVLFADSHVRIGRPAALTAVGLDLFRSTPARTRRLSYAAAAVTAVLVGAGIRHARSG